MPHVAPHPSMPPAASDINFYLPISLFRLFFKLFLAFLSCDNRLFFTIASLFCISQCSPCCLTHVILPVFCCYFALLGWQISQTENACGASPVAQLVKTQLSMQKIQEAWVLSLGWEDTLEKEMATHSSILAWKIPWTEESGGVQSMGSQRVGHHWATEQQRNALWSTCSWDAPFCCPHWLLSVTAGNLPGLRELSQEQANSYVLFSIWNWHSQAWIHDAG